MIRDSRKLYHFLNNSEIFAYQSHVTFCSLTKPASINQPIFEEQSLTYNDVFKKYYTDFKLGQNTFYHTMRNEGLAGKRFTVFIFFDGQKISDFLPEHFS